MEHNSERDIERERTKKAILTLGESSLQVSSLKRAVVFTTQVSRRAAESRCGIKT